MAAATSKTVESGAFIRTVWRHNGKRNQKTQRMTKSLEKVVLGNIGDFEVYVYPYKFPDSVFIGAYPVSTTITPTNVGEMVAAYNKARWFLKGEWQNEPKWRIATKSRQRAIVTAYNNGLMALKTSKRGGKRL
jgi:hypothetical protein